MKMTELRAENESLKQQILLLTEQKSEKDTAAVTQLKEKNRALRKSIKDLKAETALLSGKIQTLENDKSSTEQENQTLKGDLEHIHQQLSRLTDEHTSTITEVEGLREEQKALLEKSSQFELLLPEVARLRQVEDICNEKAAQVDAQQAEIQQQRQLLTEAQAKASKDEAEHQDQLAKLSNEMEDLRNRLQAELDAQREQSTQEITSLQAQKDSLTTQVNELTDKLKLVARHLERQLNEKRNITTQYEANVKEYQAFKDHSKKQFEDLMALFQKMAAELDASRAAHPTPENKLPPILSDKPAGQGGAAATDKPPQLQLLELQSQISTLNKMNTSLTLELDSISTRMKHIDQALATPQGRIFSRLFNIKD